MADKNLTASAAAASAAANLPLETTLIRLTARAVFEVEFVDGDVLWQDGDVSFTPHEQKADLFVGIPLSASASCASATAAIELEITLIRLTAHMVFEVEFVDGDVLWQDGDVSFTPHEQKAVLTLDIPLAAAASGASATSAAQLATAGEIALAAAATGQSATATAADLWLWPTTGPIHAAEDAGGWMYYSAGWQYSSNPNFFAGETQGAPEWGFVRFLLPSAIAAAKRVIAAGVDLNLYEEFGFSTGQKFLKIYATDSADAPLPADAAARPSLSGGSTTLTSASVRWPNAGDFSSPRTPGDWFETPDISELINELAVNHGGLASGSGVTLWFATYPAS